MSSFFFYGTCVSFLGGVLVATRTPLSVWFAGALIAVAVGLIALRFVERDIPSTANMLPVFVTAIALGVLSFAVVVPSGPSALSEITGKEVTVGGVVTREVEQNGDTSTIIVTLDTLHGETADEPIDSTVRVTAPRSVDYHYGDRLILIGELQEPSVFETETGRVFDYPSYLAKDGVFLTMFYPEIERVDAGQGSMVMERLLALKHTLMGGIARVLGDPHAALANGILLGVEQSLGEELEEAFRNTGLIHIVVLSGYNVTLVAVTVMSVLKYLRVGLTTRSIVGIGGILLFALVVGLGATVVRASIMAALVVIAHALGRRAHMLRALFIAVVVMVLVNPMILVYDPSFQLSAVATFGLITISPILERWFSRIPTAGGFREIVVATIATQIAVLPLLISMIGTISLVAIPVNLLALPAVAPAMLFSFLAGLVGVVSRVVAFPFMVIAYMLLGYILAVVTIFNSVPFSHVTVPPVSVWVPIMLYVILGYILVVLYRRFHFELGMPTLSDRLS